MGVRAFMFCESHSLTRTPSAICSSRRKGCASHRLHSCDLDSLRSAPPPRQLDRSHGQADSLIDVDSEFVILRRYPARIHAELAKSALEAYGVPATIHGSGGGRYGESPAFPINLIVLAEDVDTALEILGPEEKFTDW